MHQLDSYSTATSRILIRKIVEESNREYLNELLAKRRLFYSGGHQLLLSEFLGQLRGDAQERMGSRVTVDEVIDDSYDLTLLTPA